MKKRKYKIIILFLIVIIGISILYFRPKQIKLIVPIEKNYQTIDIKKNIESKPKSLVLTKGSKVSLEVLEQKYQIEIQDGASVFEAMQQLEKDNSFNFKYRQTLGLGAFVYNINNIEGSPGKYWLYYVNGIKSPVGISNYILKAGDIISWRQESF